MYRVFNASKNGAIILFDKSVLALVMQSMSGNCTIYMKLLCVFHFVIYIAILE